MTSAALDRHNINQLDRKSLTKLLQLDEKKLFVHLRDNPKPDATELVATARQLVNTYPQYKMDVLSKLDQYTAKYGYDQLMREQAELLLLAQSILQRIDFNQLER